MAKATSRSTSATTMTTRADGIRQLDHALTKHAPRLFSTVPRGVNAKLLERHARMVLLEDEKLWKCSLVSILRSVSEVSILGLTLGKGVTANAYIVPFWNEKAKVFEAAPIIGYKGMLDLAERSGKLASCSYNVVREGDEFAYELGIDVSLSHRPSTDPGRAKRQITHAYCAGKTINGGRFAVVMTASEIIDHRNRYAKDYDRDSSPWKTATEAMFLKTCVRQAFNRRYLPMASEDFRLVEAAMRAEDVIEGSYTVIEDEHAAAATTSIDEAPIKSDKQLEPPQADVTLEEDFQAELNQKVTAETKGA